MAQNSKTTFEDAKTVLRNLLDHGYPSMFAGGCVRDRLLGVTPKDYDIASTARPEQARDVFLGLGLRVIPTGIEHGTVTVITPSGPVEITTLRKDVKTDGRHAVVEFNGATFENDSARRDFTINAMFEDIDGVIHDFHGGRLDLKNKILRFVGDPAQRIREDYLRILRFFRFWARLGFSADAQALKAIQSESSGLTRVSQERITSELWGILSAPHSVEPLSTMDGLGVFRIILPETISIDHSSKIILGDASSNTPLIRPWLVLSVLLGILQKPSPSHEDVYQVGKRLRFSEKDARTLMDIFQGWHQLPRLDREVAVALDFADNLESHGHCYDLITFYGPIWHFLSRHSANMNLRQTVGWLIATDQAFQDRRRMPLPVNGQDVMDIHPKLHGRMIGDVLASAQRAFRNGEWQTRHQGLDFLRNLVIPD